MDLCDLREAGALADHADAAYCFKGFLPGGDQTRKGGPPLTDPNRDFNDLLESRSDRNRPLGASPESQLVPLGHGKA